jgi:hypothetical protein
LSKPFVLLIDFMTAAALAAVLSEHLPLHGSPKVFDTAVQFSPRSSLLHLLV